MAEVTKLAALQALHREVYSLQEGKGGSPEFLDNEFLMQIFERELGKLWERPPRSEQCRKQIESGRACLTSLVEGNDKG